MTKKDQRPKNLEAVVKTMDRIEKINKLSSIRPDSRKDRREAADEAVDEAQKKLERYARQFEKKYSPDTKMPKNPDPRMIDQALKSGLYCEKEDAEEVFYDGLDSIVDSEIPEEALDKLLQFADKNGNPLLLSNASDKNKKILFAYSQVAKLKDFRVFYEENEKPRNEEEEKILNNAVVNGVVLAQRERFKDRSREYQARAEQLAALGAQLGYVKKNKQKEYALKGFDEEIKQIEDSYSSLGDYKTAIRTTLKDMARGTREEFEQAFSLVYSAISALKAEKKKKKDK